jgi:hypothetical protein
MAGISRRVRFFIVAAGALSASGITPLVHATEPPPIHYDIGLDLKQGDLDAITVRATLRSGDDGIVDFTPPDQPPVDVYVERGTLDTSTPDRWRVTTSPHAEVVLAWRTARPQPLDWSKWDIFHPHMLGGPGAMFAFGGALLARPKGPTTRPASSTVTLPEGWHTVGASESPIKTVDDIWLTSYLVARHLTLTTRRIGTATTLQVGALGGQPRDAEKIADLIASTLLLVDRNVTLPSLLTVNVLNFDEGTGYGSTATGTSATLLITPGVPSPPWSFEVIRQFASAGTAQGGTANAWFTRGFAGYRVASALRTEGKLDRVDFARHVNDILGKYGGSPFRRTSNAGLVEEAPRVYEAQQLPGARGELFAWLIDARLREATQGRKQLADALNRMDIQTPDPGPALIAAVAAEGGGDITPLYQRYIVDGELLQLPTDTLGPCYSIGTVAYDYGWQEQHVFAKPPTLCVGTDSSATGNVGADSSAKSQRSDDEAAPNRR